MRFLPTLFGDEPFLLRRQVPKLCFLDFLVFGTCRRAIFPIFTPSAGAEELFFRFSLRRWVPKRCFCHFEAFARRRNVVFAGFYSSAMAESRFLPFSRFRPRPKSSFSCFSFIRGLGKSFFLRNSIYPRPRLNIFPFLGACRSTCSASFAPFGKECAIKFGLFNRIFQCVSPSCDTIDEHVSRDY